MKIAKWISTITVIKWTKILQLGSDWMNMAPEDINQAVESPQIPGLSLRKDIFYLDYHCRRP